MDDFDDTFWDFDGDMDDDDDTFGGLDFDGDRGMEADDDFLEDMLFLEAMHALQRLPPQSQNRHYQDPNTSLFVWLVIILLIGVFLLAMRNATLL